MRIRRYQAPDMRKALRQVREDLGAEAVILSSQRVEEGVEVTAAIDEDPLAAAAPRPRGGARRNASPAAPADEGTREPGREVSLAAVSEELRVLRGLLEQQLSSLAWEGLERREPVRAGVLRRLLDLGLTRRLAERVAEAIPPGAEPVAAWREALGELRSRVRVAEDDLLTDGGVAALIGPTGVGKTTTVAKLAARFALRHGAEQVALLTTDNYRIGAAEQLRTFGRIMGIPVTVVDDEAALRRAVARHYDRRLVLIDTAGMSQRDRRFCEQVRLIGAGSPLVRNYLVLSATTQQRGLEEAVAAFAGARPDACVITKLDESVSLGPVLSVIAEQRVPAAFVSDGQRVPEDLGVAHAGRLVSRALALLEGQAGAPGAALATAARAG